MFFHYFSTALRHMRQHLGTTLINLACLTFGLVGFLLAWGSAEYLARYDYYHERADRTVILTRFQPVSRVTFHLSPRVLREHLQTDFPELESVASVSYVREAALVAEGRSHFAQLSFADPQFVQIFDLPFTHGERSSALENPQSAVLSEALAVRLFGTANALGRRFRLSGTADDVTVTGVLGAIKRPSHITTDASAAFSTNLAFDLLVSMDMNPAATSTHWEADAYYTYAVLARGGPNAIASFDEQLKEFSRRRVPADLQDQMIYGARSAADFTAISFDALVRTDVTGVSSAAILKSLGMLVLAIACLNYMNLATAVAMTHAKEAALRKVVGAKHWQLALQHLVEGGVLTCAALILAMILASMIALTRGAETLIACIALFAGAPEFWIAICSAAVVTAVAGSIYPATLLARLRPSHAIRTHSARGGPRKSAALFVGVQFAAASLLMITVFVMLSQYRDLRASVWNPDSDPLLTIGNDLIASKVDPQLLLTELRRQPGVIAVTAINRSPWSLGADSDGIAVSPDASANSAPLTRVFIDHDFFETLGVKLLAGRTFSRERAEDIADARSWLEREPIAKEFSAIVDSNYLAQLNVASAQAAVGRVVYRPLADDGSKPPQRVRIIGVVAPSSVTPMNMGLPGIFLLNPEIATIPIVRVAKNDVGPTLQRIDSVWRSLSPEMPLKRRFADEHFDLGFDLFARLNRSFAVLALVASAIAMIGLVGMTLHVIRRRMHEIGVRKTLGARAGHIYAMLLKSFALPVVIANIAVWPIVFPLMSGYLGIFANQNSLSIAPFLGSLFVSVAVACTAVSVQSMRAARMKPTDVLRYE